MYRRDFLKLGAAVVAASGLSCARDADEANPAVAAAPTGRLDRIGVQLYTVRTAMAEDVEATLARVASLGYTEVEFAGYFDRTPQQIRAALDANGLTSPSTHIALTAITDDLPGIIEASTIIGHRYIVVPNLSQEMRDQPDVWQRVADTVNGAGESARAAGLRMGYHNHNYEFVPTASGELPLDVLLQRCDPELVSFELDLAWITAAGQDPMAYFERYPNRFAMVHVKDLRQRPAAGATAPIPDVLPDIADVGSGLIEWAPLVARAQQAGVEHFYVEHDVPPIPFDSLQASIGYLRELRF